MARVEKNIKGFTLLEMIVASFILCAAVLAIGATSSRCLSYTGLNRQYERAMQLAERQLSLIDYLGVETFIQFGRTEGVFNTPEAEYHWQVVTEAEDIDYLYSIRLTVGWRERKRNYSVTVETRLNGTGSLIEIGEE